MRFLKDIKMPSNVWNKKGVSIASETKSNQITGDTLLSFAGVDISEFE